MSLVWRVVILGGQPTSMLGTKLILEEQAYLNVTGMTVGITEGIHMVKEMQPDLVLLDYLWSKGRLEGVLGQIKSQSQASHVVIVSDEEGLLRAQSLLNLGASGILSEQASPTQLLLLIEGLREGYTFIPLEWLKNGIWPVTSPQNTHDFFQLSETEILIMRRVVRGITYDKIATEIELSRRSIDNYLQRIYVKLGVNTRAQAIEKFAVYSSPIRPLYI
ncbi:response regulator transcription factor [Paenibacillus antarcticus]|uniref:Two-component system response regulator n=1 Tax=Paenibacillus antarcticus TaxID=253703 RepID=A0A168QU90_9BACL|nr:response regulator transcription factor [Paenibacillus antarcticus]OAB48216.1 two-component system response regulator [Paenibacillus antarcticus]